MAVLDIHTDGSPILKKMAKRVHEVDDNLRQLIEDMKETMVARNGIGLAANQVGELKRVIIVMFEEGPTPFINPKIIKWSKETDSREEGCLSFPMIYGKVARDLKIVVEAQDLEMKTHKLTMEGLGARVFQHEIDHLNGITFNTRAEPGTLHEVTFDDDDDEDECDGECDGCDEDCYEEDDLVIKAVKDET
jgi:peptide deformylase